MVQLQAFINDPLIAPIYGLLVIAFLDMVLGIYRSIQQGAFDWQKLPGVLDATVLQKVIPLATLGVASFFVTEGAARTALQGAYVAGCGAALAAAVSAFLGKATGSYTATTAAQDRSALVPPAGPVRTK